MVTTMVNFHGSLSIFGSNSGERKGSAANGRGAVSQTCSNVKKKVKETGCSQDFLQTHDFNPDKAKAKLDAFDFKSSYVVHKGIYTVCLLCTQVNG